MLMQMLMPKLLLQKIKQHFNGETAILIIHIDVTTVAMVVVSIVKEYNQIDVDLSYHDQRLCIGSS